MYISQRKLTSAFVAVAFATIFCCITAADYSSADNVNVEADIKYKVSDDGTYAIVSKCLSNKATTATIASIYNNVPVTMIHGWAFRGCDSLKSITIPNSVKEIGTDAFAGCTSLTSINIPNSVKEIGQNAFHGCESLTSISIPNSVTLIDTYAFKDCSSLANVTLSSSITTIDIHVFSGCTSLTSIDIPSSVTKISSEAFQNCTSLTSINIPNSVKEVGECAFQGCKSLVSVTISSSITTIDDNVFQDCISLASVEIPDSVKKIGAYAFSGCNTLASVTIPSSVTEIDNWAFYGCDSLKLITILSSKVEIGIDSFHCSDLKRIVTTLSFKPGDYGSPSNVSIINPQKDKVPKSSMIIFNAGEGTGSAPSVMGDYESTICLPSSGFTREGYTLAAWATIIDGTTVYYPIGSIYTFRDNDGEVRTLTAHYVVNYGTIVFDVNGGSATNMSTIAAAKASGGYVHLLNGDSFYRSGYTLIGWTYLKDIVYSVDYHFPITDATSTIVMKAVWVPDSTTLYNVEFQPNSVQYANATGAPFICKVPEEMFIATPVTGFVLSGHTLSGWNTRVDGEGTAFSLGQSIQITGKLTLYAQYSTNPSTTPEIPTTCTITFDPNGGHAYLASQDVTKGYSAVEPMKPYYPQHAFLGWKVAGSMYDWSQPVMSNLDLVAQWEKMFDVVVTGTTITITPVGDYAVTGVNVDWGDGSEGFATASGLSHEFVDKFSGTITVYNEKSKSIYKYNVGSSEEESTSDGQILDKLRSFVIGHWLIILLAIIVLVVIIRFI